MATVFQLVCLDCGAEEILTNEVDLARAQTAHECHPRCGCCGRRVQLTVDDSGLCVRCDALLFPEVVWPEPIPVSVAPALSGVA